MEKTKYIFNTSSLEEGGRYKNFKELFIAATGRTPPNGKTLSSVKATLSRHLEYVLEKDLDPGASSKQAIVIMKIYNPPLAAIENRGKNGKYSDYLKPLFLSIPYYSGKMTGLFNRLGILKHYLLYLQEYDFKAAEKIKKYGINDFNIWEQKGNEFLGVQEYKRHFQNKIRQTCKGVLDSLQRDGLIKWNEYYVLLPSVLIEIEGRPENRLKTNKEIEDNDKARLEFINTKMQDKNCLLQPELLETINIYSSKWDNDLFSLSGYKDLVSVNKYNLAPLQATKTQWLAIKNYELFLRQHTYKEFYKKENYQKIEDVLNENQFFGNPGLNALYKTLNKIYAPLLMNCNSVWKELEYHTIDKKGSVLSAETRDIYSNNLTLSFIEYMEMQMSKHEFRLDQRSVEDCPMSLGERAVGFQYPLDTSLSAKKLHKQIKDCYGLE